jgi:uncharacterized protein YjbI with pentapeptide repeats
MEGRPEKKIAIVGFTASRELAPWGQDGWEIWVCNNLPKFCPDQWHRLYDLHDIATIQGDPEHAGFIAGQTIKTINGQDVNLNGRPVVCWNPQADWPTATRYPKDQITDTFGRYFTNSISWMIAHALVEGATELHVYGVDMATGTEYAAQRPSCEYMLGVAVGAGVKVHVPVQSDLLKVAAMYGAEDDSALRAKIAERQKELRQRQAQVQANLQQAQLQNAQLQGAIETTDYFGGVWLNAAANRDGTVKGLEDGKTHLAVEELAGVVEEVAA